MRARGLSSNTAGVNTSDACHLWFDVLQMRFPELYEDVDGDVDRVAARVAHEYLEGMNWVLRYYACGPAALVWRQRQQQQQDDIQGGSAGVAGASWSWCYSYHYAPLMQVHAARWCASYCSICFLIVQASTTEAHVV